jgi:hypothetical protein
MSEENVERLRPVLAEWERGNFAVGGDLLSPTALLSAFISDGMVVCHGGEEIGRFLREFFLQWRDYRIKVEKLVPLDESTVMLQGRQLGIGKGSGIEIDESLTIVFRFKQDRLGAMYWHPHHEEALKAAGLRQ